MKIAGIAVKNSAFNYMHNCAKVKFGGSLASSTPESTTAPGGGIYVSPVEKTKEQTDAIEYALNELENIKFSPNDILYMENLGVTLPFKDGASIVRYIKDNSIDIKYAKFSNPNVHACLDYKKDKTTLLVNANYKDLATFPEILAISEALAHEAGHAKDKDDNNSIQEEFDCLALNVVIHQAYKNKYKGIFDRETSFLFSQGVNLYNKKFFDFDSSKTALKERIALKYGYLEPGDKKHPETEFANDVKRIARNSINVFA